MPHSRFGRWACSSRRPPWRAWQPGGTARNRTHQQHPPGGRCSSSGSTRLRWRSTWRACSMTDLSSRGALERSTRARRIHPTGTSFWSSQSDIAHQARPERLSPILREPSASQRAGSWPCSSLIRLRRGRGRGRRGRRATRHQAWLPHRGLAASLGRGRRLGVGLATAARLLGIGHLGLLRAVHSRIVTVAAWANRTFTLRVDEVHGFGIGGGHGFTGAGSVQRPPQALTDVRRELGNGATAENGDLHASKAGRTASTSGWHILARRRPQGPSNVSPGRGVPLRARRGGKQWSSTALPEDPARHPTRLFSQINGPSGR